MKSDCRCQKDTCPVEFEERMKNATLKQVEALLLEIDRGSLGQFKEALEKYISVVFR